MFITSLSCQIKSESFFIHEFLKFYLSFSVKTAALYTFLKEVNKQHIPAYRRVKTEKEMNEADKHFAECKILHRWVWEALEDG